ncbi:MAG: DinB family protein [Anaerolineae bacterium]|nr:DinB family protein [Anaerolineae bacterium]
MPRLRELIAGLSDQELITPYDSGEWTIAQNIHHLADTHLNTYLRFKFILTTESPTLPMILAPEMAQLPDASDANVEASLTMLEGIHLRWINMMQQIDDWSQSGYYPRLELDFSLEGLLDYYSEHCNIHYRQIQGVMAKMPESLA